MMRTLGLAVAGCSALFVAAAGAQSAPKPGGVIQRVNPATLSKPNGYSHVVVVHGGRIVFVSGQVGSDREGTMVGQGDFNAQLRQAFANLKTALAAAGATPSDVVKLNYYVVGLTRERLLAVREARDAVIDPQHAPASTLVGVEKLFRDDALIEIEAEAALP